LTTKDLYFFSLTVEPLRFLVPKQIQPEARSRRIRPLSAWPRQERRVGSTKSHT